MRLKLALAPRWAQALVYGVLFGAGMTVVVRYRTGLWVPALVGGLTGGVFFGVFMGLYASRVGGRVLAGLRDFSSAEQGAVLRGSWRGPVPADPRLREAARELLLRRRENLVRARRWSVVVFAVGVALYIVLALTRSPWWWVGAAVFLAFLVLTLTTVRRMDRRLVLLEAGPADGHGAR